METKDTKSKAPRAVKPKSITREDFQAGVGKHLAELRKVHETLSLSITQLSQAHKADAAIATIKQVNEFRQTVASASSSADELSRLLMLRADTVIAEERASMKR